MVVVVFEVNFACIRGVFFDMLLLTSFGSLDPAIAVTLQFQS